MIGWLVIGTNKYLELGVECLESIKEKYTGSQSQKFFLFTAKAEVSTLRTVPRTVITPS